MAWSPQQDRALRAVDDWIRCGEQQVYRLFGYAGTGKTTLARHLAEGVDGDVLFGAYTGKAAHVLHQKGCPNASTIHGLIYLPASKAKAKLKELEAALAEAMLECSRESRDPDSDRGVLTLKAKIERERENLARPAFTLNQESDLKDAELVVIDECSMVDGHIGADLLSFGKKVLVLGDPAQLPPVKGAGYFTDQDPDFMLTEVHRQARDNPIIEMATKTRQQEKLSLGNYGESRVVNKSDINAGDALRADQMLVGRNLTRHDYNARARQLRGINDVYPVLGDRLVCLRNNHDKGLLNGSIWNVTDTHGVEDDSVFMTVSPEEEDAPVEVEAHACHFRGESETLGWWERGNAEEFDYGYALTVHKSQGSQWRDVLLFDESWCFRKDRWRWLYTGLTRAAEVVTVVRL